MDGDPDGRSYGYNWVPLVMGNTDFGGGAWSIANTQQAKISFGQLTHPGRTICFMDALWASIGPPNPPNKDSIQGFYMSYGARHRGGWNVLLCDGQVKWFGSNAPEINESTSE